MTATGLVGSSVYWQIMHAKPKKQKKKYIYIKQNASPDHNALIVNAGYVTFDRGEQQLR